MQSETLSTGQTLKENQMDAPSRLAEAIDDLGQKRQDAAEEFTQSLQKDLASGPLDAESAIVKYKAWKAIDNALIDKIKIARDLQAGIRNYIAQSTNILRRIIAQVPRTTGMAAGVTLCALLIVGMCMELFQTHWYFGFIVLVFCGYSLWLGLQDLKLGRLARPQGIGATILIVVHSVALFAAVSFMLHITGAGVYTVKSSVSFSDFFGYNVWLFLDLLPGLDISKTLGIQAQIEPSGPVTGIPVVVFKVFVIFVLLKAVNDWWKRPSTSEILRRKVKQKSNV
jgi:hypothetical protein